MPHHPSTHTRNLVHELEKLSELHEEESRPDEPHHGDGEDHEEEGLPRAVPLVFRVRGPNFVCVFVCGGTFCRFEDTR